MDNPQKKIKNPPPPHEIQIMKNTVGRVHPKKVLTKIRSPSNFANQTLFVFKSYDGLLNLFMNKGEQVSLYTCTPPLSVCTVYIPHSSTSGPDTGKALSPPCSEYYVPDRSKCSHSFCLCNTSSPPCQEKTCSSDRSSESHQCR